MKKIASACAALLLASAGAASGRTGTPGPTEVLDLDEARWGVKVTNAPGDLPIAWDPQSAKLYHYGSLGTAVVATRPSDGHPSSSIDLAIDRPQEAELLLDATRRHLFWASTEEATLRVIDLDSGTVVARLDGEAAPGRREPLDWTVDTLNGWIWLADPNRRRGTGFSPDLSRTVELPGLRRPSRVEASPQGGELLLVDEGGFGRLVTYDPADGTFEEFCRFSNLTPIQKPPRQVGFRSDLEYVVAEDAIVAMTRDCSGRWRINTDAVPRAFLVAGEEILTLQDYDGSAPTGAVRISDTRSGKPLAMDVRVRYGPRHAVYDPAARRAFVSNSLDGSVTVISLSEFKATGRIPVASSAEHVAFDALTGDRYVLDRIGGNAIYRWKLDGTFTQVAEAPGPFEIAVDPDRRLLLAATHLFPGVFKWNLDSGELLGRYEQRVPVDRGETIRDMDYDPSSGLAAVVYPERGWVSLLDVRTGNARWSLRLPWLEAGPDGGEGRGFVAIGTGRVFVAGGTPPTVLALDINTGRELVRARTARHRKAGNAADGSYSRDLLYLDGAGGRLFFGSHVLDPATLTAQAYLGDLDRVIYANRDHVLGMSREDGADHFVVLDPRTLAVEQKARLLESGPSPTRATWDPGRAWLYLAHPALGRVLAWDFAKR